MKGWRYLYAGTLVLAVVVGVGLWNPLNRADAKKDHTDKIPRFVVDPSCPKPLPNRWVTGEVAGTCIDSQDHIFTVTRRNLDALETSFGWPPSPPVIEFDGEGNVVNAWGNPAILPNGIHGCFVDHEDNVWIGGNGDGIVQKYSHDGSTLLLQIGTRGVCDSPTGACGLPSSNSSPVLLNQPADIAVDPSNGDAYIADGYGNHRVAVFNRSGLFLRQWGSPGTGPGQFAPGGGGHPGHQAGEFTLFHSVAVDSKGNMYTGETVGGRRSQKFVPRGHVSADQLEIFRGSPVYDPLPWAGRSGRDAD